MIAWLLACASPPGDPPRVAVSPPPPPTTVTPENPLVSLELVPGVEPAPAVARLVVQLSRPEALDVSGTDGVHQLAIHRDSAENHDIPLIGLYADATWSFTAVASGDDGSWILPAGSITTPALPALFPHRELRTAVPDALQPGWTLVPVNSFGLAAYLVAFDEAGDPAWWYTASAPRILEAVPTVRDTLLFLWDEKEIREIDWFGATLRSVTAQSDPVQTVPVAVSDFNHELFEDAAGRWITLTREIHHFEAFPSSYDTPLPVAPADVTVEPIIAVDPDSGAVAEQWSPWPALDLSRIGYDSLNVYEGGLQWTHANAAADAGDAWVISLRHQDAVVKMGKDGVLRWILGNPSNWGPAFAPLELVPVGDVQWPYHQHAAKWSDDGRVLMFDNGNYEASPWTGEVQLGPEVSTSRVVEYQVDESAGTVEQTLSFSPDPPLFAPSRGDADWLPNGDILGCWAFVQYEGGVSIDDLGREGSSERIIEVDRGGSVVWDLDLYALDGEDGGWFGFRAERLAPPR